MTHCQPHSIGQGQHLNLNMNNEWSEECYIWQEDKVTGSASNQNQKHSLDFVIDM